MLKPHVGEIIFFFTLLIGVGFLSFTIMSPYLTVLFLAAVFAVVFSPVFHWFEKRFKKGFAAFATVMFVLVTILVPLSFLGMLMFGEVMSVYASLNDNNIGLQIVNVWVGQIETLIRQFVPNFSMHVDVYSYISTGLKWIAQHLDTFFAGVIGFVFNIFLVIFAMFFFYRDGDKIRAFAIKWSPLQDGYDVGIISHLSSSVSSVVRGALVTASLQGILVGIGFTIFGVPNPILWGFVATIAALIPLLGTTLVTVPGVLYLYIFGHIGATIGLLIWSLTFVNLIDNVLHPILMKQKLRVHPFLLVLSVFGGLVYFGPIGFIVGPVTMSFFFTLLEMYPSIIKGKDLPK